MTDFRSSILASPTGAALDLHVCEATTTPVGVVQVNHGLAEHSARYARFAGFLAGHGFHTYAHDHRGHGGTRAQDAPAGSFKAGDAAAEAVETVIADVTAVHDLIARAHPGLPVIVFGHSMGGLIALNFAMKHPKRMAGLAVWNANVSAGLLGRVAQAVLAWERMRLGSDTPSRILPALTFQAWARTVKDRRTDFDWLSRDAAEVDRYIADPLCGWNATVGMWQAVFQMIFAGADDSRLGALPRDLPINLAGGSEDPATDKGAAVRRLSERMQRLGFRNVVTRIHEGSRHETLNETHREAVMAEFARWAAGVCNSPA